MVNFRPLPHEYMIIGVIGFFLSYYLLLDWNKTWGFTTLLLSLLLIIASLVSVLTSEIDETTLDLIAGENYQNNKRNTLGGKTK